MRFHDYATVRSIVLRNPDSGFANTTEKLQAFRRMSSEEVLRSAAAELTERMACGNMLEVKRFCEKNPWAMRFYKTICREYGWLRSDRPFYNVWPVAYELIASVTLDIAWSEVSFPYEQMLFRFPVGQEPNGIACALVHDYSAMLQSERRMSGVHELGQQAAVADLRYGRGMIEASVQFAASPLTNETLNALNTVEDDGRDETVEATLLRIRSDNPPPYIEFLYRLAVFTSLLAKGEDLITPVILAKDQKRYEAAGDEQKRWIEERAARVQGRGFDLGKRLQEERDSSPHWRNPHLCLFWTGPGRGQPLLKVRRGGVVIPKALAEVPTGFLGPETPEELAVAEATYVRVPVSARMRFEILRRDSYRCQLCGKSAGDGVRLHIDHKHAAAKGGTNTPENLWTLCEPCNLGKSDLSLSPE
jgi:hypothetical protein